MLSRIVLSAALVTFFLMSVLSAACLSQMDEIPKWACTVSGMFLMVNGWCLIDVAYDLWHPVKF